MHTTITEAGRTNTGTKYRIEIRGVLANGQTVRERYTREFAGKAHAQLWAKARIEALIKGEASPNREAKPLTLGDFWPEFRRIHFEASKRGPLKASQRANYESFWRVHIEPRFAKTRICDLTERDLKNFSADLQVGRSAKTVKLQVGRSAKTVNNVLSALSTMLAMAREWHGIQTPKVTLIRHEQAEVDYWSFAELAALADEAAAHSPYHLAVVLLGARAGLRAGEMLALRWEDVDLERRVLSIKHSTWHGTEGTTKSGKRRYVPITDDLAAALDALPRRFRVLKAPRAKHATIETLRWWMEQVQAGADLLPKGERGQVHRLRHTFCAHLAMRGVSLYQIQALAGHSDPKTTMRYAHLAPSALHEAVAALGQSAGSAPRLEAKSSKTLDKLAPPTGVEPTERGRS